MKTELPVHAVTKLHLSIPRQSHDLQALTGRVNFQVTSLVAQVDVIPHLLPRVALKAWLRDRAIRIGVFFDVAKNQQKKLIVQHHARLIIPLAYAVHDP